MATNSRAERLMPGGVPRYVRIYDNGGATADRYTVVFTKKRVNKGCFAFPYHRGQFLVVSMSADPFFPLGICQHGESEEIIDRPTSAHLGKRISFNALPEDCKKVVLCDYANLWGIATGANVYGETWSCEWKTEYVESTVHWTGERLFLKIGGAWTVQPVNFGNMSNSDIMSAVRENFPSLKKHPFDMGEFKKDCEQWRI